MEDSPLPGSCIYLADDDAAVRFSTERWLGRRGYAVYLFESGDTLLEALNNRRPDLVLVDLHMPGASGLEVLKVVKAKAPHIPVILWSAYASFEEQTIVMQEGAYAFLMKSHDLQALSKTLDRALGKRVTSRNQDD